MLIAFGMKSNHFGSSVFVMQWTAPVSNAASSRSLLVSVPLTLVAVISSRRTVAVNGARQRQRWVGDNQKPPIPMPLASVAERMVGLRGTSVCSGTGCATAVVAG